MYKELQKGIDWIVKIASIAITGPATWVVAGDLFFDIENPVLLFVMKLSALFLVEGVLFSNWLLLEFDKDATPEIKARYAFTALIMYAVLAVIGFQHEGFVGIVFRIALLLALVGSGWDTYVYTFQQMTSRVDNSVANSRRVRRHNRKLAVREALMERESEHRVLVEQNSVEERAQLHQTKLYGDRLLEQARLSDFEKRIRLDEREKKLELDASAVEAGKALPAPRQRNGSNGHVSLEDEGTALRDFGAEDDSPAEEAPEKKPVPSPTQAIAQADAVAAGTLELPEESFAPSALENDDQLVTHAILDAFADDPKLTYKALAAKLGISQSKVSRLTREAIEDGLLIKEGRGRFLTEEAEMWTGKRSRGDRPRKRKK